MKIGITMFSTDRGMPPAELGQRVEALGFDALFLPEHSHIPTSRRTRWPGARPGTDDPLPDFYYRTHDQIVALSMIGATTQRIELGTSVTLVPQHDPIWLAKQVATLDHLTRGRMVLGVGFGWNVEQTRAHGIAFGERRQRTEEAIALMRALWREDVAEYRGELLTLEASSAWPKPYRPEGPPIFIGGMGPRTYDAIGRYADGWMPISARTSLSERLTEVRGALARHGRDPDSLRVVICGATEDPAGLANLNAEGIEQACLTVWAEQPADVISELDRLAVVANEARARF